MAATRCSGATEPGSVEVAAAVSWSSADGGCAASMSSCCASGIAGPGAAGLEGDSVAAGGVAAGGVAAGGVAAGGVATDPVATGCVAVGRGAVGVGPVVGGGVATAAVVSEAVVLGGVVPRPVAVGAVVVFLAAAGTVVAGTVVARPAVDGPAGAVDGPGGARLFETGSFDVGVTAEGCSGAATDGSIGATSNGRVGAVADGGVGAVADRVVGAVADDGVRAVASGSTGVAVEPGALVGTVVPVPVVAEGVSCPLALPDPSDGRGGLAVVGAPGGTDAPLVAFNTPPGALLAEMRSPREVTLGSMADRIASTWRGVGDTTAVPTRAAFRADLLAIAGPAQTPQTTTTVVAAAPIE